MSEEKKIELKEEALIKINGGSSGSSFAKCPRCHRYKIKFTPHGGVCQNCGYCSGDKG